MAWSDPVAWARTLAGLDCVMCADIHLEVNAFSFLVAELRQSYFRFGRNQYRRGYSVVALKRHANELFELSDNELAEYWRDVAEAAAAIQRVFAPVKINFAIQGNSCPHIHCHILPQFATPYSPRLLDMADGQVLLSDQEYEQTLANLRRELVLAANVTSRSN